MATPVLNFTDPTFLPREFAPMSGANRNTPPIPSVVAVMTFGTIVPGLIMVRSLGEDRASGFFSPIPPPPMGRQIILTFPPIYKEKGGSTAITTGQLYPPHRPGD